MELQHVSQIAAGGIALLPLLGIDLIAWQFWTRRASVRVARRGPQTSLSVVWIFSQS